MSLQHFVRKFEKWRMTEKIYKEMKTTGFEPWPKLDVLENHAKIVTINWITIWTNLICIALLNSAIAISDFPFWVFYCQPQSPPPYNYIKKWYRYPLWWSWPRKNNYKLETNKTWNKLPQSNKNCVFDLVVYYTILYTECRNMPNKCHFCIITFDHSPILIITFQ